MNAKERLENLSPVEASDYTTFVAATKGMRAWPIAKKLNELTPGLNWCGCSKGHMAEEWATRNRKSHNFLRGLTNERLRAVLNS